MGLRSRGQRSGRPSWWVSVGLLGLSGAARALQLDIEPYSSRCIADDYSPEEESAIKLRAVGRVQDKIRATVTNPEGESMWDDYLTAKTHQVDIPEEDYGMYKICFYNGGREVQRVEVVLDTREELDPENKPPEPLSKETLKPLQVLFRRAELTVTGIGRELENVRLREAALRQTSDTTNSRIQWFSIFSILTLIAVSFWQITYLRSFFRSKKLL